MTQWLQLKNRLVNTILLLRAFILIENISGVLSDIQIFRRWFSFEKNAFENFIIFEDSLHGEHRIRVIGCGIQNKSCFLGWCELPKIGGHSVYILSNLSKNSPRSAENWQNVLKCSRSAKKWNFTLKFWKKGSLGGNLGAAYNVSFPWPGLPWTGLVIIFFLFWR